MKQERLKKNIDGILLLDKPTEITSNAALQKIKYLFNAKKAGHTGSLDPIATGMLPICFGKSTKVSQFLLDADKSYQVTAQLGQQTNTADCEGEIIARASTDHITAAMIEHMINQFIGESQQIPPMYSALKYQGTPLYRLAREGKQVVRQVRLINIVDIKLINYEAQQMTLFVHCSKGTYIRTLIEDIAHALGTLAHVIRLRRLMIAPYQHECMHTLSDLIKCAQEGDEHTLLDKLLPSESAIIILPKKICTEEETYKLRNGQIIFNQPFEITSEYKYIRLHDEAGMFFGIGEVMAKNKLKAAKIL